MKMKLFLGACLIIILQACSPKVHPVTGDLPPGQKKKITGEKSAKRHAPGQQKKN